MVATLQSTAAAIHTMRPCYAQLLQRLAGQLNEGLTAALYVTAHAAEVPSSSAAVAEITVAEITVAEITVSEMTMSEPTF